MRAPLSTFARCCLDRARERIDDVFRHREVDLAGKLDEAGHRLFIGEQMKEPAKRV